MGGDVDYVYSGTLVDNLKYAPIIFLEKWWDKNLGISQNNRWFFGGETITHPTYNVMDK